jgi:transglutaminase-like putative cysteine protease
MDHHTYYTKTLGCLLAVSVLWSASACGGKSKSALSTAPATSTASVASTAPSAALAVVSPAQLSPADVAAKFDRAAASISAEAFDVDTRAKTLGRGYEPAFLFVRDQVRFESYSGVLRGADGTYQSRAGNAADRALLLAYFLKAKGIPARFVTGKLDERNAARLYDHIFDGAVESPNTSPAPALSPGGTGDLRSRIFARAQHDEDAIRSALGNNLPDANLISRDDMLREIESHVWVQAQVNGAWLDLDPTFPDAVPGRTYAHADTTYDALPSGMMQNVTVRVIAESLTGGSLASNTALEVTIPAYQLIDRQVFLYHAGPGVRGLLGNKDDLTPVLWVDGDAHAGTRIPFGDTTTSAAGTTTSSGPVNSAVSAFDGASPIPPRTSFVSERLEFEIDTPDGRKDVTRRLLVDRADAAWRSRPTHDTTGLRPLARNAQGLIAAQTLHNIWFSAGKHNLAAYVGAMKTLVDAVGSADQELPAQDLGFGQQVWPMALGDFAWLAWSDHVLLPSINDTPGLRFYADAPRIFMFSVAPEANAADGAMVSETDLRRDVIRGVSQSSSGKSAVIEHKLHFGILEGALEHELGAENAAATGSTPATFVSTSSLLGPSGAVAVRPGDGAVALVKDRDAAAKISAALTQGDVIVIARNAMSGGPQGWWQIAHEGGDASAVLGGDLNGSHISGGGRTGPPERMPPARGGNGEYGPKGGKRGGGGEAGEYELTLEVPLIGKVAITKCTDTLVLAFGLEVLAFIAGGMKAGGV